MFDTYYYAPRTSLVRPIFMFYFTGVVTQSKYIWEILELKNDILSFNIIMSYNVILTIIIYNVFRECSGKYVRGLEVFLSKNPSVPKIFVAPYKSTPTYFLIFHNIKAHFRMWYLWKNQPQIVQYQFKFAR